ncbi:hypothetical protein TNCV_2160271 [Trichonephila clavipes]|nr:hypothetical protein TNCV_2160271 [Trichonephila clavipes]
MLFLIVHSTCGFHEEGAKGTQYAPSSYGVVRSTECCPTQLLLLKRIRDLSAKNEGVKWYSEKYVSIFHNKGVIPPPGGTISSSTRPRFVGGNDRSLKFAIINPTYYYSNILINTSLTIGRQSGVI